MLMCCNKIKILENYIEEKKDKELYKWWAQYLESQEKYDQALNYYKLADDFSSIVNTKNRNKFFFIQNQYLNKIYEGEFF